MNSLSKEKFVINVSGFAVYKNELFVKRINNIKTKIIKDNNKKLLSARST